MYQSVRSRCGNHFRISFWLWSYFMQRVSLSCSVQKELDCSVSCLCSACLSFVNVTFAVVRTTKHNNHLHSVISPSWILGLFEPADLLSLGSKRFRCAALVQTKFVFVNRGWCCARPQAMSICLKCKWTLKNICESAKKRCFFFV